MQQNNRYRSQSIRAPWWNYADNGAYFLTLCTQHRIHSFGDISNNAMQLSSMGDIAQTYWANIPQYFPYATLDEFIIMPNHLHGIIIINNTKEPCHTKNGGVTGKNNPMLHNNVSRIIRWYKGRVTYEARKAGHVFAWQPRFYDHIIRNEASWNHIRDYIRFNPQTWDKDSLNNAQI